jgi:putative cardiolipin synthase
LKTPSLRAMRVWILALLLCGCAGLPTGIDRTFTAALAPPPGSELADVARDAHVLAGKSGFRPLPQSNFALDARLELIRRAQSSLDLQYYLVGNDSTGLSVLRGLRDAAQRGVRVRLLIDDMYTLDMDDLLLGLAAYPNVEVRLFNPFTYGRNSSALRLWGFATDFSRLNHRMHNKLFIADGAVAIAGGRNLADEYFFRSNAANFIDFDLAIIGTLVPELSGYFDAYWNSEFAYPIQSIADNGLDAEHRRASFDHLTETVPPSRNALPRASDKDLLGLPTLGAELDGHAYHFIAADARAFADAPAKARGSGDPPPVTLHSKFVEQMSQAQSEVVLFSPYFIPGEDGLERMRHARSRGVAVRIVTNAMAASDEPLVSLDYGHYRTDMLRMGVQLFEISSARLRRDQRVRGVLGSTHGRLHAKLAFVDRQLLLVGSLNFDPRSRLTNTEIGMSVRSAELVRQVMSLYDYASEADVYEVHLTPDGSNVQWVGRNEDGEERYQSEPESSAWQRMRLFLLSLFVPEDML